MKLDAYDAEELLKEVRQVCPFFEGVNDKSLLALVGQALIETTTTLQAIEKRTEEAGVIPGDIACIYLHYAAVVQVSEDLPPSAHQRQLINAGREIGKLIARKFGDKIREKLEEKTTKERS